MALAAISVLTIVASSFLGTSGPNWNEVFHPASSAIYWPMRVPRTVLAALAGAGLALGGVIFQAIFRNSLAEPYTLGVASGASVAATAGLLLGVSGFWFGIPALSAVAFVGSAAALTLVYLVAHLRRGRDMTRLLLAGVCVAYVSSAGVLLIHWVAQRPITDQVLIWTTGSLARLVGWIGATQVAIALLAVLAYTILAHRALDLIAMGESLAAGRGVGVGAVIWTSFALVGLLTAVIVANCGPIGFVGLMVPHLARTIVGPRTLPLALASSMAGAAFLAACDGVARTPARELPVGVLTNVLGASFFFYLLTTREAAHAGRAAG